MRQGSVTRTTGETDIKASINLDGEGRSDISTGIAFMDHMLTLFAKHGKFDLEVSAKGDLEVDCHHTMEDLGLVLGEVIAQAVGDKKGIRRYGSFLLPMDEALALIALDLSGRPILSITSSLRLRGSRSWTLRCSRSFSRRSASKAASIFISGCSKAPKCIMFSKRFSKGLPEHSRRRSRLIRGKKEFRPQKVLFKISGEKRRPARCLEVPAE